MNDTKKILNEMSMLESREQKINYLRSIKRVQMDDEEIILALLEESFEEQHEKRRIISPTHTADYLISHGVTVQKHGRWVMRGGYRYCSECEQRACVTRDSEDFWYTVGTNFCPNCGAKMDGEANGSNHNQA